MSTTNIYRRLRELLENAVRHGRRTGRETARHFRCLSYFHRLLLGLWQHRAR